MVILNPLELAEVRRGVSKGESPDWDKTTINAALQAIEDLIESSRVAISNAIDSATAPYVLGGAMKKNLVAQSFRQWSRREGV